MKIYSSSDSFYDFIIDMEHFQVGTGLKQSGQVFLLVGGTELNPRTSIVYGKNRGVLHPDAGNIHTGEIPKWIEKAAQKLKDGISKEPSNAK